MRVPQHFCGHGFVELETATFPFLVLHKFRDDVIHRKRRTPMLFGGGKSGSQTPMKNVLSAIARWSDSSRSFASAWKSSQKFRMWSCGFKLARWSR